MNDTQKCIAVAEIVGYKWYWGVEGIEPNGQVIWRMNLCYPPEEGIGFEGVQGTVSETRFMTEEEITKAKETGDFYSYHLDYLKDLNSWPRIEEWLSRNYSHKSINNKHRDYLCQLISICSPNKELWKEGRFVGGLDAACNVIKATARQKADALLTVFRKI